LQNIPFQWYLCKIHFPYGKTFEEFFYYIHGFHELYRRSAFKRFMVCAFLLSDQIQFMWYFISVSVSLSNLYKGVYDSNIGIGVEHLVEARLSIHQLQLVKLLVILEQRRHSQTKRPCPEKSINWYCFGTKNKQTKKIKIWSSTVIHISPLRPIAVHTYHKLLDQGFSLRHHFSEISNHLEVLRSAFSIPESPRTHTLIIILEQKQWLWH